jgi:hypothetical protein
MGPEQPCRERRVDAFEELQEREADRVGMQQELIPSGVGELAGKLVGTEFREMVSE